MPINPFPDSVAKQVIRIRDSFDIEDFRDREFNRAKLKYFGLPSSELLDVLTWKDHISGITAIERDSDVLKDITKSLFTHKLESICELIQGDINEILRNENIQEHQLFNLDLYGGFVHKKKDGSASTPEALKALIRRQAGFRQSFLFISTFHLRGSDKIEYNDYIETIRKSLSSYPVDNLDENIDFHVSKGRPTNVYRLKVCLPFFVYLSGLPDFKFRLKRVYHYKTFVHFVIEMIFASDRALGLVPDPDTMIEILNTQISEVEGRTVMTKEPQIPEIAFVR